MKCLPVLCGEHGHQKKAERLHGVIEKAELLAEVLSAGTIRQEAQALNVRIKLRSQVIQGQQLFEPRVVWSAAGDTQFQLLVANDHAIDRVHQQHAPGFEPALQ